MTIKRSRLAERGAAAGIDLPSFVDTPVTSNASTQPPRREVLTGAGKMLSALGIAAEQDKRISELEAQVREAQQSGVIQLPLSVLAEVDGRKRRLTQEQFHELKANILNVGLISPITVRRTREDRYEIISGHNRVQVFRECGFGAIPAYIIELEEDHAELSAFYANLLQPNLPDFEKYQGFKRRQTITGKTQKELAEEAGISAMQVSRLMSFDSLPVQALEILSTNPCNIGADVVTKLSVLQKQGRETQVIEAVRKIAVQGMAQTDALKEAATVAARPAVAAAELVKFRSGRSIFAEMRSSGGKLTIAFKDESERVIAQEAIAEILQRLADKNKTGEN